MHAPTPAAPAARAGRGSSRAAPGGSAAGAAPPGSLAEQGEAVAEPVENLLHGQRPHPHRGQLDREGHPVEPPDQLGQRVLVDRGDLERRPARGGTVDEEPDRVECISASGDPAGAGPGMGSGGTVSTSSPGSARACLLVARTRTSGQLDSRSAVSAAAASCTCSQLSSTSSSCRSRRCATRRSGGAALGGPDPQRPDHDLGHQLGDLDGGKLRDPGAVGDPALLLRRRAQRQPGLADPTGSQQRHQPVRGHPGPHSGELVPASHEARELRGQVAPPFAVALPIPRKPSRVRRDRVIHASRSAG